jgi:hypothetical protein
MVDVRPKFRRITSTQQQAAAAEKQRDVHFKLRLFGGFKVRCGVFFNGSGSPIKDRLFTGYQIYAKRKWEDDFEWV